MCSACVCVVHVCVYVVCILFSIYFCIGCLFEPDEGGLMRHRVKVLELVWPMSSLVH